MPATSGIGDDPALRTLKLPVPVMRTPPLPPPQAADPVPAGLTQLSQNMGGFRTGAQAAAPSRIILGSQHIAPSFEQQANIPIPLHEASEKRVFLDQSQQLRPITPPAPREFAVSGSSALAPDANWLPESTPVRPNGPIAVLGPAIDPALERAFEAQAGEQRQWKAAQAAGLACLADDSKSLRSLPGIAAPGPSRTNFVLLREPSWSSAPAAAGLPALDSEPLLDPAVATRVAHYEAEQQQKKQQQLAAAAAPAPVTRLLPLPFDSGKSRDDASTPKQRPLEVEYDQPAGAIFIVASPVRLELNVEPDPEVLTEAKRQEQRLAEQQSILNLERAVAGLAKAVPYCSYSGRPSLEGTPTARPALATRGPLPGPTPELPAGVPIRVEFVVERDHAVVLEVRRQHELLAEDKLRRTIDRAAANQAPLIADTDAIPKPQSPGAAQAIRARGYWPWRETAPIHASAPDFAIEQDPLVLEALRPKPAPVLALTIVHGHPHPASAPAAQVEEDDDPRNRFSKTIEFLNPIIEAPVPPMAKQLPLPWIGIRPRQVQPKAKQSATQPLFELREPCIPQRHGKDARIIPSPIYGGKHRRVRSSSIAADGGGARSSSWLVTATIALLIPIGALAIVNYWVLPGHRASAASPAPVAANAPETASPAAADPTPPPAATPTAAAPGAAGLPQNWKKLIELTGIRLQDGRVTFLIVNHSKTEFPAATFNVNLRGAGARLTDPILGMFQVRLNKMAPREAREISSPVNLTPQGRMEVDWTDIRADLTPVVITPPAASGGVAKPPTPGISKP